MVFSFLSGRRFGRAVCLEVFVVLKEQRLGPGQGLPIKFSVFRFVAAEQQGSISLGIKGIQNPQGRPMGFGAKLPDGSLNMFGGGFPQR